jgi:hypothetical protein
MIQHRRVIAHQAVQAKQAYIADIDISNTGAAIFNLKPA